MSNPDHLLLTGGTGHIGFATLLYALQHTALPIRLAVRSVETSEPTILARLDALNLASTNFATRLSFAHVPDITAPSAYLAALSGITHVIHIASPLPSAHLSRSPTEAEDIFIRPAVAGTLGLLESCKAVESVKRVVLLSSVVALIPAVHWGLQPAPPGVVYSASSRTTAAPGPYPTLQAGYSASKARAFNEAEAWVQRERPEFGVLSVHPGWVIGRDEGKADVAGVMSGTNTLVLGLCKGEKRPMKRAGWAVHVRDVARVCVGALDEGRVGVERGTVRGFMAGRTIVWQEALDLVRREFGKEVEEGVLSTEGVQESMDIAIDSRETEEVFGFEFANWDEMVRSVVGHYVEISKKDQAGKEV